MVSQKESLPLEITISNLVDGSHVVTVKKPGYKEFTQAVVTGPDSGKNGLKNVVDVNLVEETTQKPKETEAPILSVTTIQTMTPVVVNGNIIITSNPPGATIILNGEKKGLTPQTIKDLPPDNYPVALTLEGYEPVNFEVSVQPGKITNKEIVLKQIITEQPTTVSTTKPTEVIVAVSTPVPTEESGIPFVIISLITILFVLLLIGRRER